jgi:hypothetical protein
MRSICRSGRKTPGGDECEARRARSGTPIKRHAALTRLPPLVPTGHIRFALALRKKIYDKVIGKGSTRRTVATKYTISRTMEVRLP